MKQQRQHLQAIANKGFTLIELIITIAIISILAKIAIPIYANYVERTKIAVAASDISTMSKQIKVYYLEADAYPASLADIGAATKLDPWGNPYIYLSLSDPSSLGAARKDRNLTPLNSDFDLYSKGKDGQSNPPISTPYSSDDVLRANDGGFIDLAKKY
jgi:general secretion pathway protein G